MKNQTIRPFFFLSTVIFLILGPISSNAFATSESFDGPGQLQPLDTSDETSVRIASQDSDDDERFEQAMSLYSEALYDSAAIAFSEIDTPEAALFAGKSYFATSDYLMASYHLQRLSRNDDRRLYDEARYTRALVDFQIGQFGRSLDVLRDLKSRYTYQNLHRDAEQLYEEIMGFLTIEQRRSAFMQSTSAPVRFDLMRYGIDYMNRSEAKELMQGLMPYYEATVDTNYLHALERRVDRLPDDLPASRQFGKAPAGIVYNIGVLLPDAEPGSSEWRISRSLYNGYLLAAEEYNRNNEDRRIRLQHLTTSDDSLSNEAAIANLAWKHHADAIIGPLFSEAAYRIRDLAEYYQIPVIPPLANADTLNIANPYLYQINPTFEAKGKAMARFAVRDLEMDTLAVITQSNQPVVREAQAFRSEAERLGATVLHYFSEDFDALAFEVDHITPWFAGDKRFIDEEEFSIKPVDGLYISVSGRGAEQLIELILNDLQATRSQVTILGNEEMAHVELSDTRRQYFDIYYSNFFHRDDDNRDTYHFQSDFQSLSGFQADNFGHLGYDVATFLFDSIDALQNPARIKTGLRHRPSHKGVITNIDFQGSHVNQAIHFLRIERDETVLFVPEVEEEDDEDENGEEE